MRSDLLKISTVQRSCGGWERPESQWTELRLSLMMSGMCRRFCASRLTERLVGGVVLPESDHECNRYHGSCLRVCTR